MYLARSQITDGVRLPVANRFLGSPGLVWLGSFSYSLYLVHHPITDLIEVLLPHHLTDGQHIVALLALAIPLSLIGGCLFSLAFERRWFLTRLGSLFARLPNSPKPTVAVTGNREFSSV